MDTSVEYNNLIEKLKEKGAFISNKIVRIHKNGYYGLYTTKKIKKGELLCKYNYDCTIKCNNSLQELSIGNLLINIFPELVNNDIIEPYIKLNKHLDNNTFINTFNNENNLKIIKSIPHLDNKILYKLNIYNSINLAVEYSYKNQCNKYNIDSTDYINNTLKKLLFSISTRGFDITKHKSLYLLPFLDLMNHNYKEINVIINFEDKYITLISNKNIDANCELFISYNNKIDTLEMLCTFDFFNPFDYFETCFDLPKELQFNNIKEIQINNKGLDYNFISQLKKYHNNDNDKINNHIKKIKKSISINYKETIDINDFDKDMHDYISFINYLNKILILKIS